MRRASNLFSGSIFAGALKESRYNHKDLFGEARHLRLSVLDEIKKLESCEITTYQQNRLLGLKFLQENLNDLLKRISGASTVEDALTTADHAIKPVLSVSEARHNIEALTETYDRLVPKYLSTSITRSHD